MKKIFRPLFAVMAIALVASCTEQIGNEATSEPGNLVKMTFSASMGENVEDTKTTYSGRKVYWEATDAITVFSVGETVTKSSFAEPELLENNAVARFSGVADASAETYYAVYPHSEANEYTDGTFSVTFPDTHTAVANGFPSGSNVSVAVSIKDAEVTEQNLQFKNVGALLAFSFNDLETALNTASVTFKAKKSETEYWGLAGATTFTLDADNLPVAVEGNATEVVVNAPEGGFNTGVSYFIPVLPVGACTGMEVVYTDLNGDTYTKRNDEDFELLRSYMFNVGKLPKPYDVDFLEEFEVLLDFKSGWPFMEKCVAAANQDTENGDIYTYKYTYDLPNGKKWIKGMNFVLAIPKDYSYTHSTSTGLKGGAAENNLVIKIPGVSGRYFKSLTFTSPDGTTGQWNLSNGVKYTGNTLSGAADGNPAKTWTFPYTSQKNDVVEIGEGAFCAIRQRRANGRIYTLAITYTITKPVAAQ